jgi:hypothetical protein
MNNQPNQEEVFKALIMMILALEIEAKAFQEFNNENIRARVCLN